jgi:formylglycine-generating enzyme required for sulfatase activity
MKAFLGIASVLWVVAFIGCMTAPTKPVTDNGSDPGTGDVLGEMDLVGADESGGDRGAEVGDPGGDALPGDVEDGGDPGLDLETDVTCNAWCGDAECGDDGCGGDCGTCGDGKVCEAGICVCLPMARKQCCGQAVCWFDSCGTQGPKVVDCPNGCSGALCIDCPSQCEGKSCGPDGCGGDCGTCAPGSCGGLVWTIAPACVDGKCTSGGGTQDCDDGNACTRDTCDASRGCGNWTARDGSKCVEGKCASLVWTRPFTCLAGQCTEGGGTENCDDANPCTEDNCFTDAGCLNVANTKPCNDNDPCTVTDACSGGACVGTGTLDCDDQNACTTDFCQAGSGCKTTNVTDGTGCGTGACNGLTFTPEASCQAGVCTVGGGGPQSCDDGKTCTVDSCDGTTGCRHQVIDGNCLIDGACQANGAMKGACLKCVAASSKTQWTVMDSCDDGKACTTDSCDTGTGACKHDNLVDGADCGGGKHCSGGECISCVPQCASHTCGDDGCGGNCGTADCPVMAGYTVTCNAQHHCEYANSDTTGWKQHDVWIYVQPGSFTMGSPSTEAGHATDEEPQHAVTFAKGYLIGKYEVTVEQYAVCESASPGTCTAPSTVDWDGNGWGTNTSGNGRSAHPQNGLTWDQAGAVCTWLGGRRPSEAEWEYAATGPVHRKYAWGDSPAPDCTRAVFDPDGSGNRPWGCDSCTTSGCSGTKVAGSMVAGASWCGALDMAGSVWEWVEDWYHSTYDGAPADGTAWVSPSGSARVLRGGSFSNDASRLRSSARINATSDARYAYDGARCVRDLPLSCGGVECPFLGGYKVSCNAQQQCEYANADTTGWKQWDVWVHVPAGSFTMGSPIGETGHLASQEPAHTVTFAEGYLLGKHEVTVAAYEACRAATPTTCTDPSTTDWDGASWGTNTSAKGRSDHPQNGLNWSQAAAVCAWLDGRLPSEAEWEYAAKGPLHRKYPWGNGPEPNCANGTGVFDDENDSARPWGCNSCNTSGCSGTSPVGTMTAGTSWSGSLDAAGNVWEWCEDWWHSNYVGAPSDGSAWVDPSGSSRVVRGGSFVRGATSGFMNSSGRLSYDPSLRYADIGARCLRPLP